MERNLIRACRKGDLLQVRELCKVVDIQHVTGSFGGSLLHIAAE